MNVHAFVTTLLEDEQPLAPEAPAKPNPLDNRSRQSATNHVYKVLDGLTKNFFRDEYWLGPNAIFKAAANAGFPFSIEKTEYGTDAEGTPNTKTWTFTVPFTNNRQKPDVLHGRLVASGAGSVQDPLSVYDLSLMVG